jgi:DNA/RNA endonuclease YhcR with UshA esterase domain
VKLIGETIGDCVDEQKLMRISFIGSIAGIVAIYLIVLNITTPGIDIGEITGSFVGSEVNVTGTVSDVYKHRSGHVFFTLDDGSGSIKVVLWESLVSEMLKRGWEISDIREGSVLNLVGEVEMYKGDLEVIPKSPRISLLETRSTC